MKDMQDLIIEESLQSIVAETCVEAYLIELADKIMPFSNEEQVA